jgi:outer membrane protein OmpU
MNNMKKIGLSALAGSLVAFSANAVEVTVSGKTEVTYSGVDGVTGNKFGGGNAITFSGSGDVNGMTATYTAVIGDGGQANSNTSETFASSSLMLDMGDMGTIGFDQGVGEFGVSTIDDKMPYAYEEIWTYTGASNGLAAAGGCNVVGYKNSFAGVSLSFEFDPGHQASTTAAAGCSGDGGSSGAGTDVSGYNFALTAAVPYVEGLSVGVGRGKEDNTQTTATSHLSTDVTYVTGYATYAAGPVTVGVQKSSSNGGSVGATSNNIDLYGVSFNVNDNFAISYNSMDNETDRTAGGTNTTEETTGIGASYTMGSASVRLLNAETDNVGGDADKASVEHTEISLLLAF